MGDRRAQEFWDQMWLKVNSFPPTTDTLEYECSFHGDQMTGTVRIRPASKPASDKPRPTHR